MRLGRPELLLGICGVMLICLTAAGLTLPKPIMGQFGIGYGIQLDQFIFLTCIQGVIYFAAVGLILRNTLDARFLYVILGGAALLRLLTLSVPPFLSNDLYRYIWDGWVQGAGINPYRYLPVDPHLAALRDRFVYPNINRAAYAHTIYPPAAEMIFLVATKLTSVLHIPAVFAMKLAMVALEGAGIWAMLRLLDLAGLPRARILIYAWNPVPVWEFAGNGHVDAIAICFISLAFLAACQGRNGWSAAAVCIATLAKFLPLILVAAFWRRWDRKFAGIFIAVLILFYLPYLGVGKGVFGFLGGYNAEEGIDSGQGIFLLSALSHILPLPAYAAKAYLLLLAFALAAMGGMMVFGRAVPVQPNEAVRVIAHRFLLLGCLLMAGISPHYPWYYCWLLIPACIIAAPSAIYLVTASLLLYLNPGHAGLFWPAFLYGPFFVLAACEIWLGKSLAPPQTRKLLQGNPT